MAEDNQKKLSFTGDINGLVLKTIGSLAALGTFIPVFFNGIHQMLGLSTWTSYILFVLLYFVLPLVVVLAIYRPQRENRNLIRLLHGRNAGNHAAGRSSDIVKYCTIYVIALIGSGYVLHPWLPITELACYVCGILAACCIVGAIHYRWKAGPRNKLLFIDVEYGLLTTILFIVSVLYFSNLSKKELLEKDKKPTQNEFLEYDAYQKLRDFSAQLDLIKSSVDRQVLKGSGPAIADSTTQRRDSLQSGYNKCDSALGTVKYRDPDWKKLRDSTVDEMIRIQDTLEQLNSRIAASTATKMATIKIPIRGSISGYLADSNFVKKIKGGDFKIFQSDLDSLNSFGKSLREIKSISILDANKKQYQDSINALTSNTKIDGENIRYDLSVDWSVFSNHMYSKGLVWYILLLFFAFSNLYIIRCDLWKSKERASSASVYSEPMPLINNRQQSGEEETKTQTELGKEGTVFKSFIMVLAMLLVPVFKQINDKPADLDKPFMNFNLGDVTGIPALSSGSSTGRSSGNGGGSNATTINYQVVDPKLSTPKGHDSDFIKYLARLDALDTSVKSISKSTGYILESMGKINESNNKITNTLSAVQRQMKDPGDR